MRSLGFLLLAGAGAVPVGAVLWSRTERSNEAHARVALEAVPGGAVPAATPARGSEDAGDRSPLSRRGEAQRPDTGEPELVVPAPPQDWRARDGARRSLGEDRAARPSEVSSGNPALRPGPHRRTELSRGDLLRARSAWDLIDELRDDDVPWNATEAYSQLSYRIWAEPARHLEVHEAALPWIASEDAQLANLAGGLVLECARRERERGATYWPNEALLDQVTTWLIDPPAPYYGHRGVSTLRLVRFALDHVDVLEPRLLQRLRRPAGRDVFLPAFVLGASGRWEHTDLLAPLLVARLRDNDIDKDACMAQEALLALGPGVIVHLEAARPNADEQQRLTIEALLWEFRWPARSQAEAFERSHLNVICYQYASGIGRWRFCFNYN